MENELFVAIKANNLEKLRELLDLGYDIYEKDVKGQTLLHIAMTINNVALLKTILERVNRENLREFLNYKNKSTGNSALHVAAKNGFYENALILLQYGANFEIKNNNGKKPIDLTCRDQIRELLQLINKSFAKIKKGDMQLISDLEKSNLQDFISLINCRNNQGHTMMQLLVLNDHDLLLRDLFRMRSVRQLHSATQAEINGKVEVEKLIVIIQKYHELWYEKREALMMLSPSLNKLTSKEQRQVIMTRLGKICCEVLEKAHEVLLAFRKFHGKERTLTPIAAMKILEEIFELLGFNPDEILVIVGEEASYYEKLTSTFKNDIGKLMHLLDTMVDGSITFLLRRLFAIQAGHEKEAMNGSVSVQKKLIIDCTHRSHLCYAAEKGNKKLIRLLLKSGEKVVEEHFMTSPVYQAVTYGHSHILKLLLKHVGANDVDEFIDRRGKHDNTALHEAAKQGDLNVVKILMSYRATYSIIDAEGRKPIDVSTKQEVNDFLNLVDECFDDAKEANDALIDKLKVMETYELLAVTGTRNSDGQTLAIVAAKAGAKDIAGMILKMTKEAKEKTK